MAVQGPVVAGVIRQGVVDSISNVSWNQRAGGALLGVPTDDVGLLRDPTRDVDVLKARPKMTKAHLPLRQTRQPERKQV
jgi:hypothetical protein